MIFSNAGQLEDGMPDTSPGQLAPWVTTTLFLRELFLPKSSFSVEWPRLPSLKAPPSDAKLPVGWNTARDPRPGPSASAL